MKSGLKIRELREKKEMNITQLAAEMKVSRQTITAWEETDPFPKGDNFKKLCDFFEVDEDFFEVESILEKEKNHAEDLIEELRATLDFVKSELAFMRSEMSKATEQNTMLVKALTGNFPENSVHEVPEEDNVKVIPIWRAIQNAG